MPRELSNAGRLPVNILPRFGSSRSPSSSPLDHDLAGNSMPRELSNAGRLPVNILPRFGSSRSPSSSPLDHDLAGNSMPRELSIHGRLPVNILPRFGSSRSPSALFSPTTQGACGCLINPHGAALAAVSMENAAAVAAPPPCQQPSMHRVRRPQAWPHRTIDTRGTAVRPRPDGACDAAGRAAVHPAPSMLRRCPPRRSAPVQVATDSRVHALQKMACGAKLSDRTR